MSTMSRDVKRCQMSRTVKPQELLPTLTDCSSWCHYHPPRKAPLHSHGPHKAQDLVLWPLWHRCTQPNRPNRPNRPPKRTQGLTVHIRRFDRKMMASKCFKPGSVLKFWWRVTHISLWFCEVCTSDDLPGTDCIPVRNGGPGRGGAKCATLGVAARRRNPRGLSRPEILTQGLKSMRFTECGCDFNGGAGFIKPISSIYQTWQASQWLGSCRFILSTWAESTLQNLGQTHPDTETRMPWVVTYSPVVSATQSTVSCLKQ